jgi:choline dehydrogenase-like flavoprotein
MEQNSFDAIVVGSGMSGGWAAKELTEKGLKTLVLERGRMVRHPDYPTATKDPWDLPYGNRITQETQRLYPHRELGEPRAALEKIELPIAA